MATRIYFNEVVDNEDLEQAFNSYLQDVNPDTEHDFIKMIGVSRLYAPVQILGAEFTSEADGSLSAEYEDGIEVQYQVIKNGNGELFFPAFTSQVEYDKWAKTSTAQGLVTSLLSFDQFSSLTIPNDQIAGIVINPFGQNIVLNKTNLQYMVDALIQMNQNATISLDETTTDQTAFAALLARDLPGNLPDIRTVWAVDLVRGDERTLVYVLDADAEDANAQFFAYAQVSHQTPEFSNVLNVSQIGYPRLAVYTPIYNNVD